MVQGDGVKFGRIWGYLNFGKMRKGVGVADFTPLRRTKILFVVTPLVALKSATVADLGRKSHK